MKKQKFTTARTTLLALTCAALLAIPTISARAQASDTEQPMVQSAAQGGGLLDVLELIKLAQAQALEGSWIVSVTPVVPPGVPQPPSFHAYSTFARGGGGTGSDRGRPFSKQHIAWTHLGGHNFATTHKEDLFDLATGNFTGTLTVRNRLVVTGRDEYIGVANGEFRDAAGNITMSRCATVKATRIKVEPLPEQCQSITPPQ